MVKYQDNLDQVFAALADPTRRAILSHLASGDQPVSTLANPHDMSLPAVTKHLRVLEAAGLVKREKSGRVVRVQLQAAPMRAANDWLERYQIFWRERLDSLARFLDEPKEPSCPPSSNQRKPPSASRGSSRSPVRKSSARGPIRRR